MSLTPVTTSMLRAELTVAELRALPKQVLGGSDVTETQVDAWLEERVTQACDRVVAAINSCSRNEDIGYSLRKVPASCVRMALVLARHAVISAVPGLADTLEGGSRSAEYSAALNDLGRLASCDLAVQYTLGDGEASEDSSGGATYIFGEQVSNWRF